MRLNDPQNVTPLRDTSSPTVAADKASKATADQSQATVKTDKVSSDRADQALRVAQAAAAEAQAGHSARLMELANQIRQGTYTPDPNRIAQQILEDAEVTARIEAAMKA